MRECLEMLTNPLRSYSSFDQSWKLDVYVLIASYRWQQSSNDIFYMT